jgi:hypothetical protein
VRIEETQQGNGSLLELSIPDMGSDLLSLKLFAPTREDRNQIVRRFLNDPVFLYQGVLSLLTGDIRVLGEIAPEENPLF